MRQVENHLELLEEAAAILPILFPLIRSGFAFGGAGGINGGWNIALSDHFNPSGWYQNFRAAPP